MEARWTRRSPPATLRTSVPTTTARIAMVRRRRNWSPGPRSAEPVTHSPHGRERQVVPELLAQLAYVHVDGPLVPVPTLAPHPVEQLAAGERETAVGSEVGEEVELPRREAHDVRALAYLAPPRVDHDVGDLGHRRLVSRGHPGAAQYR